MTIGIANRNNYNRYSLSVATAIELAQKLGKDEKKEKLDSCLRIKIKQGIMEHSLQLTNLYKKTKIQILFVLIVLVKDLLFRLDIIRICEKWL